MCHLAHGPECATDRETDRAAEMLGGKAKANQANRAKGANMYSAEIEGDTITIRGPYVLSLIHI